MALSGSVVTSSCEGRSMTLKWSASQSIANNTSTISWSLVGSGSYSGYVKCGGFYVSIGGNVVCNWSTDSRVQVNPSTTVASGSITLAHNADGTKSFNVVVQAGIYEYTRNCSGSGSFTLNTIARATTPTISPSTVALGSTLTISMPRATSSFTHTLKYAWGSLSGTIGTGLGTSATWTPSQSIVNQMLQQIPNNTSGYGSITCETYNGSTKIGTKSVRFDATVPSSCIPTISSATVTVDNSANSVIKGWGLWVAGYSKALVKATAAGNNGSTITGFTVSGGASASTTGTSLSYTTGAMTKTGSVTFSVVAKDSRGRSSATTTTSAVTVYEYSAPTITLFTAQRNSSSATKVIVQANWTFSSVNSKNAVTATLYYKTSTATSYTTYGTISKNTATTLTTTFSESTSYDFRIIIKDSVGNSAQMDSSISTGAALLDFRTGGKGLAVGKMSESDTFEVALATKFTGAISLKNESGSVVTLKSYITSLILSTFYPVGSIYISTKNTNPANFMGGTWVAWGSGKVPVGVNSSDTDFSTVEKTGGAKSSTHSHWTNVSNDGSTIYITKTGASARSRVTANVSRAGWTQGTGTATTREDSTYNETISILQPYITCYMWKRTA